MKDSDKFFSCIDGFEIESVVNVIIVKGLKNIITLINKKTHEPEDVKNYLFEITNIFEVLTFICKKSFGEMYKYSEPFKLPLSQESEKRKSLMELKLRSQLDEVITINNNIQTFRENTLNSGNDFQLMIQQKEKLVSSILTAIND